MKFSYFPGCSLLATGKEYDMSMREVSNVIGIELVELDDWNCCGATAAYAVDRSLSIVLPARNLALSEEKEMDIIAPCAACFHFLARANEMLKTKTILRDKVNEVLGVIGLKYKGTIEVRHPLEILVKPFMAPILDKIKEKVVRPLTGLKIAPYYGCLFLKPPSFCKFEDPENPQSLDILVKTVGAISIAWGPYRTRCCGGALQMIREEAMLELSGNILMKAKEYGADCIVTACPFCHLNLDMKQKDISSKYDLEIGIPVLYFSQLLGLALDINPKKLGLDKIIVSPAKLLKSISHS
ncbi:MAG: CoB--CoM heterodisulfide reductase iron-sulfur subunit B family protein [Candidatus Bathyarchaeia archaeon]